MTPVKRVRSRTRSALTGSSVSYNSSTGVYTRTGPFSYVEMDATSEDYIKKGKRDIDGLTPPSDLYLSKREVVPPIFNLIRRSSGAPIPNLVLANMAGSQIYSTGPIGSPPSGWSSLEETDDAVVAKLLAKTNPFRYEVSVPVMIVELAEAASLLRLSMANLHSLLGSGWLNIQFGIKPMIQDIKTLDGIVGKIESRIKEFNSLISKGGVRRRVLISKGTKKVPYTGRASLSYPSGTVYSDGSTTYRSKVWASCRWRPQRDKLIELDRLSESRKLIAGISLGLEGGDIPSLWEMLPFSWLVDYFVNVGDILQAVEKSDLVVPFDICVMKERRIQVDTRLDCAPHNTTGATIRQSNSFPGTVDIVQKYRTVKTIVGISDLLHFGIMTELQAVNLTALIMTLKSRGK